MCIRDSPSASAVTYYLGNGDITVDQDETRGAFSYQGEDKGNENRTYVNEDEADKGTIYVKDGNAPEVDSPSSDNSDNGTEAPTPTDNATQSTDASGNNTENSSTSETTTGNTITVMEDVKKTEKTEKTDGTEGNDVKIVVEGVNVNTSTQTEVSADNKEDKKMCIRDRCKAAAAAGNFDISAAEIIDPENYAGFDEMVNTMVELRKGKQTAEECTAMLKKSNYFGTMLVKMGKADCLLGGATYSTADTIRPALQLVKTKKGAHLVSSCFILDRDFGERCV